MPYDFDKLSPRQWEVAILASQGLSYAGIAKRLNLSVPTVRTHMTNIYNTLHFPVKDPNISCIALLSGLVAAYHGREAAV